MLINNIEPYLASPYWTSVTNIETKQEPVAPASDQITGRTVPPNNPSLHASPPGILKRFHHVTFCRQSQNLPIWVCSTGSFLSSPRQKRIPPLFLCFRMALTVCFRGRKNEWFY